MTVLFADSDEAALRKEGGYLADSTPGLRLKKLIFCLFLKCLQNAFRLAEKMTAIWKAGNVFLTPEGIMIRI